MNETDIRRDERIKVLDELYVKMESQYNYIDHSELDEIFKELRSKGGEQGCK